MAQAVGRARDFGENLNLEWPLIDLMFGWEERLRRPPHNVWVMDDMWPDGVQEHRERTPDPLHVRDQQCNVVQG